MPPPGVTRGPPRCSSACPSSPAARRAARAPRDGVGREHPEHDLRGAARAARPPRRATARWRRSAPSASTACACSSYWQDYAPAAEVEAAPGFDATDPGAYPPARGTGSTRCSQAPPRAASPSSSRSPGRCRGGRRATSATTSRGRAPKEFQAFATAVGRRYGDRVGQWSIWNEPNHPQFLRPQFVKRQGEVAAHLPQPVPSPASAACGLRQRRRHAADRRDRAARHPAVVAPLAFLRGALCLNRSYKRKGGPRAHQRRRLRPPRLHDACRPALSPAGQGRRDDRRAQAAHQRAQPRRQGRGITARLGIYLTEFGIQSTPDPLGVSLAKQVRVPGDRRAHGLRRTRVKSFSQYLLGDDRPRKGSRDERYGGFESGLRRANGKTKPSYAAFRLPLAVEAYGPSDVLWGRVRPVGHQDAGDDPRLAAQGQAVQAAAHVETNSRGVFGLRARHHDKQRYRVQWTAPDGKVWRGPPIRATQVTPNHSARVRRAGREADGPVRDPRRVPGASGCCRRSPRTSRWRSTTPFHPRRGRRDAGRVRHVAGRRRLFPHNVHLRRRGRPGPLAPRGRTSARPPVSRPRASTATSATCTPRCGASSTSTLPAPCRRRRRRLRLPTASPTSSPGVARRRRRRRVHQRPSPPARVRVPRARDERPARRLPHLSLGADKAVRCAALRRREARAQRALCAAGPPPVRLPGKRLKPGRYR